MRTNPSIPLYCLLAALAVALVACSEDAPIEGSAEDPAPEAPVAEPASRPGDRLAPDPAKQAARKAKREARHLARLEAPAAAEDPASKSPEDRAVRKQQRAEKKLVNKAWWNKGKRNDLALSDEQITSFDQRVLELLDERGAMAGPLQQLADSTQAALAAGDLSLVQKNLNARLLLEQQWLQTRNQATIDILAALDPEQLAQLPSLGRDVASLDWLDLDLQKGKTGSRRGVENRRQRKDSSKTETHDKN